MASSVMPYVGGKARYADWLISLMPPHRCYIEPFGGSGTVLYNKPRSNVEVYNDINDDLVQFFDALRESPDELKEWLERVPFSRSLHERWATEFYEDGYRPDDEIERAGRFYALRYMQWGGAVDTASGFRARNEKSPAKTFSNARNQLSEVAERFREVIIECKPWADVVDDYDGEGVLFYLDPPYLGREHYDTGEMDHQRLLRVLSNIEGEWIVSYDELPDGLDDIGYVKSHSGKHRFASGKQSEDAEISEKAVCSFDPDQTPQFVENGQSSLQQYAAGGGT